MRLKYKRLRLRIEELILKEDGHFQTFNHIIDLPFKLKNDIRINDRKQISFQNLKSIKMKNQFQDLFSS